MNLGFFPEETRDVKWTEKNSTRADNRVIIVFVTSNATGSNSGSRISCVVMKPIVHVQEKDEILNI